MQKNPPSVLFPWGVALALLVCSCGEGSKELSESEKARLNNVAEQMHRRGGESRPSTAEEYIGIWEKSEQDKLPQIRPKAISVQFSVENRLAQSWERRLSYGKQYSRSDEYDFVTVYDSPSRVRVYQDYELDSLHDVFLLCEAAPKGAGLNELLQCIQFIHPVYAGPGDKDVPPSWYYGKARTCREVIREALLGRDVGSGHEAGFLDVMATMPKTAAQLAAIAKNNQVALKANVGAVISFEGRDVSVAGAVQAIPEAKVSISQEKGTVRYVLEDEQAFRAFIERVQLSLGSGAYRSLAEVVEMKNDTGELMFGRTSWAPEGIRGFVRENYPTFYRQKPKVSTKDPKQLRAERDKAFQEALAEKQRKKFGQSKLWARQMSLSNGDLTEAAEKLAKTAKNVRVVKMRGKNGHGLTIEFDDEAAYDAFLVSLSKTKWGKKTPADSRYGSFGGWFVPSGPNSTDVKSSPRWAKSKFTSVRW